MTSTTLGVADVPQSLCDACFVTFLSIPTVLHGVSGPDSVEIINALVPDERDRARPGFGSSPRLELEPAFELSDIGPPAKHRLGVDMVEQGMREAPGVSLRADALHRRLAVGQRLRWVR